MNYGYMVLMRTTATDIETEILACLYSSIFQPLIQYWAAEMSTQTVQQHRPPSPKRPSTRQFKASTYTHTHIQD